MDRRRVLKSAMLLATASLAVPGSAPLAQGRAMDRTMSFYARTASDKGLRFLRAGQSPRGDWYDGDPSTTALALRAFVTSYQAYRGTDGPFITKPLTLVTEQLFADTPRPLALAILALRNLDDNALKPQLDSARLKLADIVTEWDIAGSGDQINTFYAVEALRGSKSAEPVRTQIANRMMRLQLDSGAFPATDGTADPALTFAGVHSLYRAGADPDSTAVLRALDWAIAHFTPDTSPGTGLPPLFHQEAARAGMFAAERLGAADRLGPAANWRDTLAYALLATQGDDGGWLAEQTTGQRAEATARAVVTLNTLLG